MQLIQEAEDQIIINQVKGIDFSQQTDRFNEESI